MAVPLGSVQVLLASVCCRPQRTAHIVALPAQYQTTRSLTTPLYKGLPLSGRVGQRFQRARATVSADAPPDYVVEETVETPEGIPNPIVKIDNQSDKYHTVVSIQFGDRLGELLDTIAALKRLGISIRKARITPTSDKDVHTFLLTDSHTADKIIKSARLEEIRFVILNNLLKYHPEAGQKMGGGWGQRARKPLPRVSTDRPLGARQMCALASQLCVTPHVPAATSRTTASTTVVVRDSQEGGFSEMDIVTTDRPGLLTDIVKVLKDINVNVISAEVDTEGPLAKDQFLVSYHGDPLNSSMSTLVQNALQYYLGLAEVEAEESY